MRTDESYSRPKILVVIWSSILTYIVCMVLSINTYYTSFNKNEVNTNYNKDYLEVVQYESPNKQKEKDDGIKLGDIKYDPSTLYLDYSAIVENKTILSSPTKSVHKDVKVVETMGVPNIRDTSWKGYMCVHTIKSKSSKQWELLRSGKFKFSSDNGLLKYGDYYVVALGSYYMNYKIGSTFRITLDSGVSFDIIVGDMKSDNHTDTSRMYRPKGNSYGEVVEFVVACGKHNEVCENYNPLPSHIRSSGNISSLGFKGNVVKVEKLNDNSIVKALYG